MPITPYGGTLVDLRPEADEAAELRRRARSLPRIRVSAVTLSDLYLLAVGALSPLRGFMGEEDYDAVLENLALANGLPWSIPVTLPATRAEASGLRPGDEAALVAPDGEIAAIVTVRDVFGWNREREASAVYGTNDRAHPGVARLDSLGELLVGGEVRYLYPHDVS